MARQSLPAFQAKLRAKYQPEALCQQAGHAVSLYWEMVAPSAAEPPHPKAATTPLGAATPNTAREALEQPLNPVPVDNSPIPSSAPPFAPAKPTPQHTPQHPDPLKPSPHRLSPSPPPTRQKEAVGRAPGAPAQPVPTPSPNAPTDSAELKLTGASWVWVYDGLTSAIQVRHYSPKTLDAYPIWTRKFQTFTHSKDPRLLSMEDVKGFLSFLAVAKKGHWFSSAS